MTHLRIGTVAAALAALAACGGPSEPAPVPPAAEQAAQLGDVDPAALAAQAEKRAALVPTPTETQAALAAAGIDTSLASLVPATRTFRTDGSDLDRVAVRAGVVIADLLLTVRTSSQDQLLAQLDAVRASMATLGGGRDIDATIGDLSERVRAGALDREELLKELDEIASVAIPELEFNGVARIVPLVQAGSWLEGAHLVARAVQARETPAAADGILKQPAVVAYFAEYARERAPDEVPSEVAGALAATLDRLAAVASKPEALDAADVDAVAAATGAVLALL